MIVKAPRRRKDKPRSRDELTRAFDLLVARIDKTFRETTGRGWCWHEVRDVYRLLDAMPNESEAAE